MRLQNPAGSHDYIVAAVGMVITDLMGRPEPGGGLVTEPRGRRAGVSLAHRAAQRLGLSLAQRARAAGLAGGVYGPGGAILLKGAANGPGRRTTTRVRIARERNR